MEFKYAIGDEVTLRGMCTPFILEERAKDILRVTGQQVAPLPQKMMVVDRLWEECVGGVQIHYKVRVFSITEQGFGRITGTAVGRDLFTFGEFELVSWADALNVGRDKDLEA